MALKRSQDVWNRDNTLAEAFRNNNGAALEQLTKNITLKKWKKYLRKSDYGNKLCSDTMASFWANGTLLITPAEQIFFLKKLFKNQLPFKNKYCNLVKELMLLECKPVIKCMENQVCIKALIRILVGCWFCTIAKRCLLFCYNY
jgi:beta-lactamase class D